MNHHDVQTALRSYIDPAKAAFYPRFFKTGPGQYGEGDQFLGITVPNIRTAIKPYHTLPLDEVALLLASKWHEDRLAALLILVWQYSHGDARERTLIYEFYLTQTTYINNWDLVDTSCRDIVGWHIYDHPELQSQLDTLAASDSLWERRIAMVSTFYFLMYSDPEPTLRIATALIHDRHDLMQKAVGWMLRELGKRVDPALLVDFLREHYSHTGRTALRYAIEHFPAHIRARYLRGDFTPHA
ncbi:MAG: DNA alkylation repair protein [Candidatus Saccharimonas sp.]